MTDERWTPEGRALLHHDVTEVLNRYARAFDRKDWDALQLTYHPDAIDDHGSFLGTAEDYVAFFRDRHAHIHNVMHVNANVLILEVDPEAREVLTETYCVGYQRLAPTAPEVPALFRSSQIDPSVTSRLLAVGNRYLDVISERAGELRFLRRRVIYEWSQVSELPLPLPFGEGWATGTRDPDDPSFTSLAALRAGRAPR